MYIAIDSNGSSAYYGTSAEELIEELTNCEGDIDSRWEFICVEEISQMRLSLSLVE